eukprot:IDg2348t1
MGKETGGAKVEDPDYIKANEVAEIVFAPQSPFVVEGFKKCEGLGRVAIMEGNTVVMLGKAISTTHAYHVKRVQPVARVRLTDPPNSQWGSRKTAKLPFGRCHAVCPTWQATRVTLLEVVACDWDPAFWGLCFLCLPKFSVIK